MNNINRENFQTYIDGNNIITNMFSYLNMKDVFDTYLTGFINFCTTRYIEHLEYGNDDFKPYDRLRDNEFLLSYIEQNFDKLRREYENEFMLKNVTRILSDAFRNNEK